MKFCYKDFRVNKSLFFFLYFVASAMQIVCDTKLYIKWRCRLQFLE